MKRILAGVLALCCLPALAEAQESADELAKKLSNPIASLISVPFQFNADFGAGPETRAGRRALKAA